jgi:hypothetical protein
MGGRKNGNPSRPKPGKFTGGAEPPLTLLIPDSPEE